MYSLSVLTDFWPLTTLSFVAAVLAVFYYLSVQPGEILAFWGQWVNKQWLALCVYGSKADTELINRRVEGYQWMLKPILTCPRCIGGQAGLWLCMLAIIAGNPISLLSILYVVSLSSLLATLIHKEINR